MTELTQDFVEIARDREKKQRELDKDQDRLKRLSGIDVDAKLEPFKDDSSIPDKEVYDFASMFADGWELQPNMGVPGAYWLPNRFVIGGQDIGSGEQLTADDFNGVLPGVDKNAPWYRRAVNAVGEYLFTDVPIPTHRDVYGRGGTMKQLNVKGIVQDVVAVGGSRFGKNIMRQMQIPSANPYRWLSYLHQPELGVPLMAEDVPEVPLSDPESMVSEAAAALGQFAFGYVGPARVVKLQMAGNAFVRVGSNMAEEAIRGGLAEMIAFDPNGGNLATALREFGVDKAFEEYASGRWFESAGEAFTSYLEVTDAAAEDKSRIEQKLAQFMEGAMLDAGFAGVTAVAAGMAKMMMSMDAKHIDMVLDRLDILPLAPGLPRSQRGQVGWHGTGAPPGPGGGAPFKKFSMEYIGTGEGAQAFGYGLYIAESRNIGQFYANKLGGMVLNVGTDTYRNMPPHVMELFDENGKLLRRETQWQIDDYNEQIKFYEEQPDEYFMDDEWTVANIRDEYQPDELRQSFIEDLQNDIEFLTRLMSADNVSLERRGALLRVEIDPEAVKTFLDWDAPPDERVLNIFRQLFERRLETGDGVEKAQAQYALDEMIDNPAMSGQNLYWQLGGADWAKASAELNEAGIQGIKFLDASSRDRGGGTSNFVLFNDDIVRITHVNDKPLGERSMGGPGPGVVTDSIVTTPVFRGEYGKVKEGQHFQTRRGSLTFTDDPDVASTYAMEPNDRGKKVVAPRVTRAYLDIRKPVINSDDPFIDAQQISLAVGKAGWEASRDILIRHQDHVMNTQNWADNFSSYESVEQLLKERPELATSPHLYLDAFVVFDDKDAVQLFKEAGYDGAIHTGNGESAMAKEYRVFDKSQIRIYPEALDNFEAQYPETVAYLRGYVTDEEARMLTEAEIKKIDELLRQQKFGVAMSDQELDAFAKAGSMKRNWYAEGRQALQHVFKDDFELFVAVLASTSPRDSVEGNLREALAMWKAWDDAGRPIKEAEILKVIREGSIRGTPMSAHEKNVAYILANRDIIDYARLSGPKVDSFWMNLLGDEYEVTLDAWMAKGMNVPQSAFGGKTPTAEVQRTIGGQRPPGDKTGVKMGQYIWGNAAVRKSAERLTEATGETWTPAQVQAAVWSFIKPFIEDMQWRKVGLTESINQLDDATIAAVPDFAQLLKKHAGDRYAREVETLPEVRPTKSRSGLAPDERRALERGATRAQKAQDYRSVQKAATSRGADTRDLSDDVVWDESGGGRELPRSTLTFTLKESDHLTRTIRSAGFATPTVHKLGGKKADRARQFYDALAKSRDTGDYGYMVDLHAKKDYANMDLYLTDDGSAGFALDGDNIVSVFNTKGGPHKGVTPALLSLAVQQGGRRLDAYDTALPELYNQVGFKVVARVEWGAEFEPDMRKKGWTPEALERFNGGRPDVVFMVYDPDAKMSKNAYRAPTQYPTTSTGARQSAWKTVSYEEAQRIQLEAVNKLRGAGDAEN